MKFPVKEKQVEKCVAALLKHFQKSTGAGPSEEAKAGPSEEAKASSETRAETKLQLFEDAEYVTVMIGLNNLPAKKKVNAYKIPLKNSLYAGGEICLMTKDPSSDYEQKLLEHPLDEVKLVVDVSTLRTDYRQYEDKRTLMASYDLFLADDRILPLLPPLIGKKFFTRGKQPVSVTLTRKNISNEIARARDSTYFYMRGGISCAFKVAKTDFSEEEIVENILHALPVVVSKIPGGWKNVQSVSLKTPKSLAFPLYRCLPQNTRIEDDQQKK